MIPESWQDHWRRGGTREKCTCTHTSTCTPAPSSHGANMVIWGGFVCVTHTQSLANAGRLPVPSCASAMGMR